MLALRTELVPAGSVIFLLESGLIKRRAEEHAVHFPIHFQKKEEKLCFQIRAERSDKHLGSSGGGRNTSQERINFSPSTLVAWLSSTRTELIAVFQELALSSNSWDGTKSWQERRREWACPGWQAEHTMFDVAVWQWQELRLLL